ncbi:unnamed protein product [Prorocentrum cordatum]|uniref:EF-hand domain-containing protein n=1 Tax=Prorocentrum cordatum TaxID=2364126 RepID=A0ABN9S6C6_9DINO|nr:unnamed protein product [Polarella glacialis]
MAAHVPRVPKSHDDGSPEAYDGLLARIGAMMDEHHRRMVGDIEQLLEGQDRPPRPLQPSGPAGQGCAAGPAKAEAPPTASPSSGAAGAVAGEGGAAPSSASASWPRSPRGEQSEQPVALLPAPGARQKKLEPAAQARAAEADDLSSSATAQRALKPPAPRTPPKTKLSFMAELLPRGGSIEDLPIARRLSKEKAAVLTPAGKRVLNRMNHNRSKKEKENDVVVEEGPFFHVLRRVVQHPGFDLGCAGVIISNSVLIGLEVDWKTVYDGEMPHMKYLNYACAVFFLVELILRLSLDGFLGFFVHSENRKWNMFDSALVTMSLLDALFIDFFNLGDDATGVSGGLKTLKMLRIVRICRVFRFFAELNHLAVMIIDSLMSLVWALVMLFIVVYVFAIFFTHGVTDKVRSSRTMTPAELELDPIARHFGSLWQTLQTLFQSMLNGISWHVLTDALREVHPTLLVLFLFYISFSMMAVLNVITGVFVDSAVDAARTQREYLVQKEIELKEKWCQEMRSLFHEMDADGSGTVCLSEVRFFFNDDRLRSYFTALGLETQDAERLFLLLDEGETGDIDIDMFLNGCLRLKGTARSIDVYQLLQDNRKMYNRVLDLQEAVATALKGGSVGPSAHAKGSCTPQGDGSKRNSEVQRRDSSGCSIVVEQF